MYGRVNENEKGQRVCGFVILLFGSGGGKVGRWGIHPSGFVC